MSYILRGNICVNLLSCGVEFNGNLILYFILIFICVCLFNYGASLLLFMLRPRNKARLKAPPKVPFLVPILGNLPLKLLWNPRKRLFWNLHPVRISLLGQSIYVIQGTANIAATFKQRHLSSFSLHGYILRHLFNLPRGALATYHADKSGWYAVPYPNSQVEPRNRRLQTDLANRLHSIPVGGDWITWDNLLDLFLYDTTSSAIDSLCGRYLLRRHPELLKVLWTLDDNLWKILWRFSRFLAPASYAARDRALAALKDWHTWARENFDPASVDEHGDDPYWGTRFFRDRQERFRAMDGFDAGAIASQDPAFLWVYAETLRLRVNGFFLWRLSYKDMDIHGYRIPRNHYVVSSPIPSHMDPAIWSIGQNADHPVHEFRVGRWLKPRYSSQPIKPNAHSRSKSEPEEDFTGGPANHAGAWMPFGGGYHACPGRQFAKVIVMLSTVMLVIGYDVEVLTDVRELKVSMRNFGFGVSRPAERIKARIKRREM
ncbi:cytochrome P450 [Aspergillus sergii]|uniref:Cytochrome P450 n=1 Tax=Aspergillus sergii TaxID=1034303 RepID=A0A5N6XCQ5_9EURO|nr:cytochrome P450 [Aspergillus sergii]